MRSRFLDSRVARTLGRPRPTSRRRLLRWGLQRASCTSIRMRCLRTMSVEAGRRPPCSWMGATCLGKRLRRAPPCPAGCIRTARRPRRKSNQRSGRERNSWVHSSLVEMLTCPICSDFVWYWHVSRSDQYQPLSGCPSHFRGALAAAPAVRPTMRHCAGAHRAAERFAVGGLSSRMGCKHSAECGQHWPSQFRDGQACTSDADRGAATNHRRSRTTRLGARRQNGACETERGEYQMMNHQRCERITSRRWRSPSAGHAAGSSARSRSAAECACLDHRTECCRDR